MENTLLEVKNFLPPKEIPSIKWGPLNFQVNEGECLGIFGVSGIGKTTLFRQMTGLESLGNGKVYFKQKTPKEWGWPLWRRQIQYSPSGGHFFQESVQEAIRAPWEFLKLPLPPWDPLESEKIQESLGFPPEFCKKKCSTLSSGEVQRIFLWRSLLMHPAVLLVDEPTGNLDPISVEKVEKELFRFKQKGGILLVVSHSQEFLAKLADHQIELKENFHGN